LNIRIPGWAAETPVPGGLYNFAGAGHAKVEILLNGKPVTYQTDKGYAVIDRTWQNGDEIEVKLPMEVRQIKARKEVKADADRIALQRGPIVYCVEGADNAGEVWNLLVPENPSFNTQKSQILNEAVVSIQAKLQVVKATPDGLNVKPEPQTVTAIPYYTWANRGRGPMQVWLPVKMKSIRIAE
jgi:DUF1680 family protein